MRVPTGWEVHLTYGLLAQLNFHNGWFDSGTYGNDRPLDLARPEALYVYLEQLNTAENFVIGAPVYVTNRCGD